MNPGLMVVPDDDERVLAALDAIVGRPFVDRALPLLAVTHRSYVNERGGSHNERLEFLGDAILSATMASILVEQFPDADEGNLSRRRGFLVSEATLSVIARDLHLGPLVRVGKGEEIAGVRDQSTLLADCLEALLGAVFLDGGFDASRATVTRWLGERVRTTDLPPEKPPKNYLQEITQRRWKLTPSYVVQDKVGPDHRPTYTVSVLLDGETIGSGTGPSIPKAGDAAAADALRRLKSEGAGGVAVQRAEASPPDDPT